MLVKYLVKLSALLNIMHVMYGLLLILNRYIHCWLFPISYDYFLKPPLLTFYLFQLQNWNGQAPNMYDISGSAHFINKCDNGIVIHRNHDKELGPLDRVQVIFYLLLLILTIYHFINCGLNSIHINGDKVCVRKVRNKVIGGIGDAYLSYNRSGSSTLVYIV